MPTNEPIWNKRYKSFWRFSPIWTTSCIRCRSTDIQWEENDRNEKLDSLIVGEFNRFGTAQVTRWVLLDIERETSRNGLQSNQNESAGFIFVRKKFDSMQTKGRHLDEQMSSLSIQRNHSSTENCSVTTHSFGFRLDQRHSCLYIGAKRSEKS